MYIFLPISERSKLIWVITGFEIRSLECFSTIMFLGNALFADWLLRLICDPCTSLNPRKFFWEEEEFEAWSEDVKDAALEIRLISFPNEL